MLRLAGVEICGKKVLILGTGGTSLTANAACKKLGAKEAVTVSRSGRVNYENVYTDHPDAQIIINTTPVGMYPSNGISPIDISKFADLSGVADVIYNPGKTRLILDAQKRGIPTAGGLSMLVAQAVEADRIFFDKENADVFGMTKRVLGIIESGVRNIILVGMPGCGKTTVGKILAKKLSRELIDADDHLTQKEGRTPEDIIKNDGEDAFRVLETETLRDITKLSGKVISCGGGAVLREENRELIRQNSICIYIQRPTEKLATAGRPLSAGGTERLKALFETRDPLYKECADFCVALEENGEKCAQKIIERFGFEK
jgi:shikimate dehydrogenase